MIVFRDSKSKVSINEIKELEKYSNLKFPKDYIDFLLTHNGGYCEPDCFVFKDGNGREDVSSVERFYAIYNGEYNNLKDKIYTYKIEQKRMPSYILPIADDGLGNNICLSCAKNDNGFVYFWDHENEVNYSIEDDTICKNLYFISESLNEFFKGLKSYEDLKK